MTGSMINGLSDGDYTVTVTDANGCTGTSTTTVDPSSSPDISLEGEDTTCGEDNGSATSTTTGGQSPYTYIWSTGSTSSNVSSLGAGNYRVTVTDAAGCTDWAAIQTDSEGCTSTSTVSVDDSNSPSANTSTTGTSCGEENGTATATATSGTAPYSYVWSNGSTSAMLNNLAAGEYTVTVTDAVGCTATSSAIINESTNNTAIATSTDTSCGENNGTATASASGGTAPYTYVWSNGSTSVSLSGLADGTYSVTVTDAAGCTATASTSVSESSSPTLSTTTTATTCGEDNGSATASATDGVAPYTYAWSTGSSDVTIENLSSGSYTVTVTDANGCTSESTSAVDDSSSPSLSATGSGTFCGLANGNVSALATDGTAPYTYEWSNGVTDANQSGLSAGLYTVTVTDAIGCTKEATATIEESNPISVNISSTDTTCDEDNGTATAQGTDGLAPYTYEWFDGSTGNMINGLIAGSYPVTVTDANGCTITGSATVEDSSSPTVSVVSTDTTCGQNNGSVTASATDGTAPYVYLWSTGSTDQTIEGLSAGSYTVTITDAVGCAATASTNVAESINVNADASATETTCGMNNGMATVDAINGTEPYTYLWSTAATTQMIMGLEPGDYMVTVTDANGCSDVAAVLVEDSEMPSVVVVAEPTTCGENNGTASAGVFGGIEPYTYEWVERSTTVDDSSTPTVSIDKEDSSCGDVNGSLMTMVSGGVGPYTYAWSNGATTVDLNDVAAGTYSLTVTDAAGCTAESSATIEDSDAPMASATVIHTTCGENNGSATVTSTGGQAPYSYVWSSADTDEMIDGLEPATYTVTVTDANGCTDTASVTVNDSTGPDLTTETTPTTCGENNGGALAMVTSGTTPYTYLWSNGSTASFIGGLEAGTYTLTVTDAAGCTQETSVTVSDSDTPSVSLDSENTACGEENGSVTANASGGQAPYTYLWSNNTNQPSIDDVPAGNYTVTITDNAGCTAMATATVGDSGAVNADASATYTNDYGLRAR